MTSENTQEFSEKIYNSGDTAPANEPANYYPHGGAQQPSTVFEHPKTSNILTITLLSFIFPVLGFFSWYMASAAQKEEKQQGMRPSPIIQSSKIVGIVMSVYAILAIIFIAFYLFFMISVFHGIMNDPTIYSTTL